MHKSTTFLFMVGLASSALAQSAADTDGVKDITPKALSAMLGQPQVQVIDVNEADNYAFAHVPGAKLAAYDAITPDVLPADKSSAVVFYCWSPECPAAEMAAEATVKLGYKDVYCMHAGITGWQDAGLPTEP